MGDDGGSIAGGGAGLVELLDLLLEVVVEVVALDEGGVRLLELIAVEADEDGLDVVDKLVNPCEVEERTVYSLSIGSVGVKQTGGARMEDSQRR